MAKIMILGLINVTGLECNNTVEIGGYETAGDKRQTLNLTKLVRKLKIGGIKLQCDAVIFRNPHQQQLYSALNFRCFIYLSRLMKFTAAFYTNKKQHTQGLAGKTVK